MKPPLPVLLTVLALTPALLAQEPAPPPVSKEFFKSRRQELMKRIGTGVVVLLGDQSPGGFLPFVQGKDFYYLTGVNEPGVAALLFPETGEDLLLAHPYNRFWANWNGKRLAPGEASAARTGFDKVGNVRQLHRVLEEHLGQAGEKAEGKRPVVWTFGAPRRSRRSGRAPASLDARPSRSEAIAANLAERFPGLEIKDLRHEVGRMRGVKTAEEIEQIRRSTDVACQGIAEAMKSTTPGMYEYQVAAVARYVFTRLGAGHDAYDAIVGGGPNGCVLHYKARTRKLEDDDLIVMDYGGTINGYATDVTRTFPANGVFSPEQRKLVEDVYEIQQKLIASVKPGQTLRGLSRMCSQLLREKGYRSDHGPSHQVGLDVHDKGGDALEPGMLITVEPGAYLRKVGMGCRIEDVILVTEDGGTNLSGHLPSRPDDIEKLMARPGIAQQPIGLGEPASAPRRGPGR